MAAALNPLAPLPERSNVPAPVRDEDDELQLAARYSARLVGAQARVLEAVRSSRQEKEWKLAASSKGVEVRVRRTPFIFDPTAGFAEAGADEGKLEIAVAVTLHAPPRYARALLERYELRALWDPDMDAARSRVLRTFNGGSSEIAATYYRRSGPVAARVCLEACRVMTIDEDGAEFVGGAVPVSEEDAVGAPAGRLLSELAQERGGAVVAPGGTGGFLIEPVYGTEPAADGLFHHFLDDGERPAHSCRVTVTMHPDIGGRVPDFLVQRVAPRKALAAMTALRKCVERVERERCHPPFGRQQRRCNKGKR